MVADSLSRKQHDLHALITSSYESKLKNLIKKVSREHLEYRKLTKQCLNRSNSSAENEFHTDVEGFPNFKNKIYIPNQLQIKKTIFKELHDSAYSRHPGYQKLITSHKTYLYWINMNNKQENTLLGS